MITLSTSKPVSPFGRDLKSTFSALQSLLRTKAINFTLRLATVLFRPRRNIIDLIRGALALILTFTLLITPAFASNSTDVQSSDKHAETAIFAGGCFWCMEPPFDKLNGVISTTSGYTAGHKKDPTYSEVSAGSTGHTEAVKIIYDTEKISYGDLLEVFWKSIDPVAVNRQFCDSGKQYRSGIYYLNKQQETVAKQSLAQLEKTRLFKEPIATEIYPASTFYPAEEYHQDYYQKNPLRYKFYRYSCGRDQRLSEIWDSK